MQTLVDVTRHRVKIQANPGDPDMDGRELSLTRYTQPEPELKLLLDKLRFAPPAQAPLKITAVQLNAANAIPQVLTENSCD